MRTVHRDARALYPEHMRPDRGPREHAEGIFDNSRIYGAANRHPRLWAGLLASRLKNDRNAISRPDPTQCHGDCINKL